LEWRIVEHSLLPLRITLNTFLLDMLFYRFSSEESFITYLKIRSY